MKIATAWSTSRDTQEAVRAAWEIDRANYHGNLMTSVIVFERA